MLIIRLGYTCLTAEFFQTNPTNEAFALFWLFFRQRKQYGRLFSTLRCCWLLKEGFPLFQGGCLLFHSFCRYTLYMTSLPWVNVCPRSVMSFLLQFYNFCMDTVDWIKHLLWYEYIWTSDLFPRHIFVHVCVSLMSLTVCKPVKELITILAFKRLFVASLRYVSVHVCCNSAIDWNKSLSLSLSFNTSHNACTNKASFHCVSIHFVKTVCFRVTIDYSAVSWGNDK